MPAHGGCLDPYLTGDRMASRASVAGRRHRRLVADAGVSCEAAPDPVAVMANARAVKQSSVATRASKA
jgi:hypothetical protein